MKGGLLRLYHRSPPFMRSVAASLRGYYLRGWRYAADTDERVEAALERDKWSPEQWKNYQETRLAFVLHRAATQVPYYRQQWEQRRRNGDHASWEILDNWPMLHKEQLRQHPVAFVADDSNRKKMFHEHTSGTSGTPIDLWWSRDTVREWFALIEARARGWFGVSRHDRWTIFGGQLVTPITQDQPPFWVWNRALNQLYCSSYHLHPKFVKYYLEALQRYKIRYLWGYTSSLYFLADEALRSGISDLRFEVIITNAEPLYDYQRKTIEAAFQSPVCETYGMAEIVAAASECPAHHLHLWPEVGIVEVFEGERPLPLGQMGELACTGLLNADMPLIRYQVGDRGALTATPIDCSCGIQLPCLGAVEGRVDDVLVARDGRRIGRLDPVFKANMPIREAQIIQETLDRVRVLYVPTPEFTSDTGNMIAERIRDRMGDIQVILEPLAQIPLTANGKFRAVISHVSAPPSS